MKAHVGDHLVILGRHIHRPVREGEILEVRGPDGDPPFLVHWTDTDRDSLLWPGSDAHVEPATTSATTVATTDPPSLLDLLGRPARDEHGDPSLAQDEVVALVRHHIDLETLRTTDHDPELWALWQDETRQASAGDHNADVLDRVVARIRVGE